MRQRRQRETDADGPDRKDLERIHVESVAYLSSIDESRQRTSDTSEAFQLGQRLTLATYHVREERSIYER
jgi:hypothetical protein